MEGLDTGLGGAIGGMFIAVCRAPIRKQHRNMNDQRIQAESICIEILPAYLRDHFILHSLILVRVVCNMRGDRHSLSLVRRSFVLPKPAGITRYSTLHTTRKQLLLHVRAPADQSRYNDITRTQRRSSSAMSATTFNPRAQEGFAKAANYDANRPSYRDESLKTLLHNVRLLDNKGATVVDLAAGKI